MRKGKVQYGYGYRYINMISTLRNQLFGNPNPKFYKPL